MRDLALDPLTHDLAIAGYDLGLVDDLDQVVQELKIRLLFFRGEWFLDTGAGVPYYQDILKKGANRTRVDAAFKQEILGAADVARIVEYSTEGEPALRKLHVDFRAQTRFGEADVDLVVP